MESFPTDGRKISGWTENFRTDGRTDGSFSVCTRSTKKETAHEQSRSAMAAATEAVAVAAAAKAPADCGRDAKPSVAPVAAKILKQSSSFSLF